MILNMAELLVCPICTEGKMNLSTTETAKSYADEFDLDDIETLVDGIIDEYWIFVCTHCGATQKYNFKDIERLARKEISKKVLGFKASGEIAKSNNMKFKYLIYCGVCKGYDSKGSCPQRVYDECQIRRIPIEL